MKPPFPYFGGKQRLAAQIVATFPEHEHYVEPYGGGMSVLLAKNPSPMETVNDLDGDLMNFWRVLRDHGEELTTMCALTPHSRAEHTLSRDRSDCDDIERARRVWVALTQGRGGQLMRTGWRYYVDPAGSSIGVPGYLAGYVSRMPPVVARLAHVSLENRPALEVIAQYGHDAKTLLYVDPPYLGTSRGSTNGYRHEMKDETAHRNLADHLRECEATVILSGYPSPLYDDLYANWSTLDIDAWNGQGNHSRESANGARVERLWSNRPFPTGGQSSLFDLIEEPA